MHRYKGRDPRGNSYHYRPRGQSIKPQRINFRPWICSSGIQTCLRMVTFLFLCMYVLSCIQLFETHKDCSRPGFSVYGLFQARILEGLSFPTSFYSFKFLPFRMGMFILCLSHYCVLGADNLFSSFTGPQMERNFVPKWIIPRISSIPDLDDEIWNLVSW